MDHEVDGAEPIRTGSLSRLSSTNSSLRRHSFGLSVTGQLQVDDDIESRSVSEAGDIGDRALHSDRFSGSGRTRFSIDNLGESGVVVPIPEDALKRLQLEAAASPFADAGLSSGGKTKENDNQLSHLLLSISCLVHLAVFGILGNLNLHLQKEELQLPAAIASDRPQKRWQLEAAAPLPADAGLSSGGKTKVLTRYLLGKLFGPGVVDATSDESYMYHDLPSNMVGSFLMGWWGAVFKSDISMFSSQLAIGLTTGYLGSLTTFSGWNQKMIELSVEGQWVFAVLGFFLGMLLVAVSFTFGVHTAKGFKWTLKRINTSSESGIIKCNGNWRIDNARRQMIVFVLLVLILGFLWGLSGTLMKRNFNSDSNEAQLWFGCIVGAIGVWIRFYLARLNGRGLARAGYLKWIPFGTLIANVLAACVMAALATVKKEVNDNTSEIVASGLQIGLCGCLSTVSTFIAEFIAMIHSTHPWRAYVYASTTIIISFILSILIYSVPAWTRGYD